jgi:peptide/nickel transport system permease protein
MTIAAQDKPTALQEQSTPQSSAIIENPPSLVRRLGLNRPWIVILAAAYLVVVVLVAIFAPFLQPYEHTAQDLFEMRNPPIFMGGDWRYILGSDDLGRDVLSRVIYGTRISVMIALVGTVIGAVLGSALGIIAAHFRGWVDEIVMMFVDAQSAMPFIIFALAVLVFFGGEFWVLVIVVGVDGWQYYARLARGMVFSSGRATYVEAVRSLGVPMWRVYLRHVLPNILPALMVQFTINLPGTIMLETTLSFLGLGVQPPMTSLGQMLGLGRNYLLQAPWIAITPGLIIFLITLSISVLGDWLRDHLDPSLR